MLAWGAEVIRPPLEGDGLELVYSVNDLLDYARFRKALEKRKARRLLVIGGGLIGSEFANDLINGGYELEVVDPLGHCLPGLLPEAAGKAVQAALEERGVIFHFGTVVERLSRSSQGGVEAMLADGGRVEADMVVSAVGVRPRLELAAAAGIKVGRGILADRLLQTSAEDVYTLGDCAEVEGHVLYYVAPLMACARALGRTLAGDPTRVAYPAMPVTVKTPACPVVVAPPPVGAEGEWQVEGQGHDVAARFVTAQGQLLGFALTGAAVSDKNRLQKALPALLSGSPEPSGGS